MNVVYCIDSLASGGGTERVLTTKANWLCCQPDMSVWVVALKEENGPFFSFLQGINIIRLSCEHNDKVNYRKQLKVLLDEIKPDVTVAVAGMSIDVLPDLKNCGKKILEFHYTKNFLVNFVKGIRSLRFKKLHILKMYWLQWKLRLAAQKYDRFVGLTLKDVGLWGNPRNMTYVHNPLSFKSEKKSTCRNHTIISVGSWTPAKGMDQLLEAFGPLAKDYPDWTVELYGSGQDELLLKEIIQKYSMNRQVRLNSPVKNIGEKLVDASIYAFPSRSDGFGLVITEAMECGLPTVAMDCPCGPCEIVTDNTGIVVPDKDILLFRRALKTLMDDEALRMRMGAAAVKEVGRFYPDNIMPKWMKIFNE